MLDAVESERFYFVRPKKSFDINGARRSRIGDGVLAAFEAL